MGAAAVGAAIRFVSICKEASFLRCHEGSRKRPQQYHGDPEKGRLGLLAKSEVVPKANQYVYQQQEKNQDQHKVSKCGGRASKPAPITLLLFVG